MSPFRSDAEQPSQCSYELHRATPADLAPDPEWTGMASYHRWLPFYKDEIQPLEGVPITRVRQNQILEVMGESISCESIIPHAATMHLPGLLQAQNAGHNRCHGPGYSKYAWEYFANSYPDYVLLIPDGWAKPELQDLRLGDVKPVADALPLNPWHHPFRLEGMKLVAFDIWNTCPDTPTILLHDPSGEWAFALLETAKIIQQVCPGSIPFRLILLEERPWNPIGSAFEGAPDTEAQHSNAPGFAPCPQIIVNQIATHLAAFGGTAMACHAESMAIEASHPPLNIMETLVRTGFIDEDDHLVYLQPFS